MILDVDMGNSRIKSCSSAHPERMFVHTLDSDAFACWLGMPGLTRVRVAAVVDSARVERMLKWCRDELRVEPEVAVVKDGIDGLQLAYSDESALGVDRWLALHAAKQQSAGCDIIVVSGGTALTVDYLSASGRHLGGYIVPGWRVAGRALLGSADRIGSIQPQLSTRWQPGTCTLGCVEGGLALMYRSIISSAVRVELPGFCASKMIITGGDGELLSRFAEAEIDCVYNATLVLQGLAVVLP